MAHWFGTSAASIKSKIYAVSSDSKMAYATSAASPLFLGDILSQRLRSGAPGYRKRYVEKAQAPANHLQGVERIS